MGTTVPTGTHVSCAQQSGGDYRTRTSCFYPRNTEVAALGGCIGLTEVEVGGHAVHQSLGVGGEERGSLLRQLELNEAEPRRSGSERAACVV
ncbi:MAG: hypothetical protein ACPIOQ_33250 [Promethearchaeia archaeon]